MLSLFYYGNYIPKFKRLITFESLELKHSYIPHLKVLLCGIDASSPQWCDSVFIWCYTHLKLALLLHKTATAKYILQRTVLSARNALCVSFIISVVVYEGLSVLLPDKSRNMSSHCHLTLQFDLTLQDTHL